MSHNHAHDGDPERVTGFMVRMRNKEEPTVYNNDDWSVLLSLAEIGARQMIHEHGLFVSVLSVRSAPLGVGPSHEKMSGDI
jgi:hypothetical protein